MRLIPVASPHQIGADIKTTNTSEARNRAIAAYKGSTAPQATQVAPQAEQAPVANPSAVQPEEMTVVKAPEAQAESVEVPTSESSQVVTETQPPKEEPTKTEDPVLARQFAQLARQEKALRAKQAQQDQAYRQKEAELKAKEEALQAKDQQYNQGYISREELAKNPLKYLTEAGMSYDKLTEQVLNAGALDPRVEAHISKLEAKIQQLEQATEKVSKSAEQKQAEDYQLAIKQIDREVKVLVDADDSYEAIKSTGSYKDVRDLIERTYKEDGYIMTTEEAANLVENELIEEIMKVTKIGKIKSRLQPSTPVAKTQETKQPEPKPQTQDTPKMKTLTNNIGASRPLSARERAIAVFKGQKI